MAKKLRLFKIGYSEKAYCAVFVRAETKKKALEMFNNGDIETDFMTDFKDSDGPEFEYIKEVDDAIEQFITEHEVK